jgi:hypothetical protein
MGTCLRVPTCAVGGAGGPQCRSLYPRPFVRPQASDFFPVLLSDMLRTKLLKPPMWENEIALIFQSLVLHLGRALVGPESGSDVSKSSVISPKHLIALQNTRLAVHQEIQRKWSVRNMASVAEVSPA